MIAGPEYAGGLAGSLKNALDWCVGAERGVYRKPAIVLSASASGGVHALRQLARTLLWQGAFVVGQLGVAAPRSKADAEGRIVDNAIKGELVMLGDDLIQALAMKAHQLEVATEEIANKLGINEYPHKSALRG